MSETNVVSFEEVARARGGAGTGAEQPYIITDEELRERQTVVPLRDCHVAFDRMSYIIKLKSTRIELFHNLSAAFPKGRKIVLFGHQGSGKSVLLELMLRERPPSRGRVHVNSRLSWPVHLTTFLDPRLSIRDNAIFTARVLGVEPREILNALRGFCGLGERQLNEPVRSMPNGLRRRFGMIVIFAANFDLLLMDLPPRASQFDLSGDEGEAFEELIYDRDYIASVTASRLRPTNADLAYILYNGRLYLFDDVDEAAAIYDALPTPVSPGIHRASKPKEEDDGDDYAMEQGF
ncbi:ATP-binding cassette domain-containing protein [Acuticoccus mangrovi]|uniref:ATP-binding cassette domain-containing protein n=1 Tax=Acuticoccus mangrovi TaxID=2796142 RepID=A0A934IQG3_9HYPH|nr:ATP-binding cassette domain-containing protein [Acuticoccus mangrovi]MBJ3778202.1 ATP-binding cassette domain-containing protein [Acuticoccus mangrovi]